MNVIEFPYDKERSERLFGNDTDVYPVNIPNNVVDLTERIKARKSNAHPLTSMYEQELRKIGGLGVFGSQLSQTRRNFALVAPEFGEVSLQDAQTAAEIVNIFDQGYVIKEKTDRSFGAYRYSTIYSKVSAVRETHHPLSYQDRQHDSAAFLFEANIAVPVLRQDLASALDYLAQRPAGPVNGNSLGHLRNTPQS